MRVLVVDASMVRGFAERLCSAVNEGGRHQARCLIAGSWYDQSTWNGDFSPKSPVYSLREKGSVAECLEWADLVHFLQATSYRTIGRTDLIGRKAAAWQVFGSVDQRWEVYGPIWTDADRSKIRQGVVAEGWSRDRYWSRWEHAELPGLFTIWDRHHQPLPIWKRGRQASFAPMSKKSAAAPKAYRETQDALRRLPLDLMHRIPWDDCMRRKARAWVGIDEVVTPMVHFSGFEYLALGVPCLSSFDEATERSVREATGADRLPFLNASLATLRVEVERCLAAKDEEWAARCVEVRKWMERHYDPREGVKRYEDFWQRA
jgi:hypothetical protein